jgi:hypothetical protein
MKQIRIKRGKRREAGRKIREKKGKCTIRERMKERKEIKYN